MWQSFDETAARRKARARSIAGVVLFLVSSAAVMRVYMKPVYQNTQLHVCHETCVPEYSAACLPICRDRLHDACVPACSATCVPTCASGKLCKAGSYREGDASMLPQLLHYVMLHNFAIGMTAAALCCMTLCQSYPVVQRFAQLKHWCRAAVGLSQGVCAAA